MYLFSILKAITVQKTSEKAPQPHCAEKKTTTKNVSNKHYNIDQYFKHQLHSNGFGVVLS